MSFLIQKWIQSLVEPMTLLVLGLILFALLSVLAWGWLRFFSRGIVLVLALAFASAAFFPVGDWALIPLENKHADVALPERVDGILLLTGDENPSIMQSRGVAQAGHAAQRYLALGQLARQYPQARIVIVGTTDFHCPAVRYATREVSARAIESLGLAAQRIEYETHSRTTRENAVFTVKQLGDKEGEVWLLLTSAFHLPRSVLSFEGAGFPVVPVAADYFTHGEQPFRVRPDFARQTRLLSVAAHEYYGLLWYRANGWIDRLW